MRHKKIDPPVSIAQLYEIRIKGHLDDRWAEWFEDLTITLGDDGYTLLSGPVIDQAALHGLLKKVRDSGMPLVSINQLPPSGEPANQSYQEKKMNTINKPFSEIPAKLSTLWIFVTFNIAFADIIGFIEPGTLERIISGNTGFEITPALIVIFSLLQVIPIAMIVISRWFRREVNRWFNIVASLLTLLYVVGGGNWESTSYYVFVSLEIAAMLGIIWLAWKWRNIEA